MDTGTIKNISLFSESLQETIDLLLYVPANYTPLTKYNILLASDGKDYFQLGGLTRFADKLQDCEAIEKIIIVGIPYKNIDDRKRKYLPTGDQHEAYLNFLTNELLPYLEGEFSISEEPSSHGLIGDSMAATVSLLAAVKYPHIFGKVILQSPYVDEHVLDIVDKSKDIEKLTIFHIIGKKEDAVVRTDKTIADFLSPNRKLHELLVHKKVNLIYEEFEGNHSWKYWKPYLEKALIKLFG